MAVFAYLTLDMDCTKSIKCILKYTIFQLSEISKYGGMVSLFFGV